MGLNVTVLGASGSFPGPGAACSGYLLRGGGATVWMDAGSGTMANLQRHVPLEDVDAIVLSHEHPDHWSDLDGFHVAYAYGLKRSGIRVYAPAAIERHIYHFNRPSLSFQHMTDGATAQVAGMRFTFSRTDHGPETLAALVEADGRTLVYTADTGPDWSPSTFGRAPDVLLAEATFTHAQAEEMKATEGSVPGHLTGAQAAEMAVHCGAGRLVLTHLWPGNDPDQTIAEAASCFSGPISVARENEAFDV